MSEHSSVELPNGNELAQVLPDDEDVVRIVARNADSEVELYSSGDSVDALACWSALQSVLIEEHPENQE